VTRVCAWCDGPIPARARRAAVCCSVRCRAARRAGPVPARSPGRCRATAVSRRPRPRSTRRPRPRAAAMRRIPSWSTPRPCPLPFRVMVSADSPTPPPNPTAAKLQAADGFCQDPLRVYVHPAPSPQVAALRSQGLDRFREPCTLLRRVGGGHPPFHPHAADPASGEGRDHNLISTLDLTGQLARGLCKSEVSEGRSPWWLPHVAPGRHARQPHTIAEHIRAIRGATGDLCLCPAQYVGSISVSTGRVPSR